jgi:hypothetical protein
MRPLNPSFVECSSERLLVWTDATLVHVLHDLALNVCLLLEMNCHTGYNCHISWGNHVGFTKCVVPVSVWETTPMC